MDDRGRRRSWRPVVLASSLALAALTAASVAQAGYVSWSYGKRFSPESSADNAVVDDRIPAQRFAEAMSAIGYESHYDLDGATALDAWERGGQSNVLAIFGHASWDLIQLDDPVPGTYFYDTAELHFANVLVGYGSLIGWNPQHNRAWREWTPALADKLKIAILAGCHTFGPHPERPSAVDFPYTAWEVGIDSAVGFRDLIYQPSDGIDFSGNYYWTRFAAYAQAGYTLRDALNQAKADLFAHDGRYDGYDQWAVGGAAAGPENARFTPPGAGAINGYPLEKSPRGSVATAAAPVPLDLALLTVTTAHPLTVEGASYTDYETAANVTYRLDRDSRLVALSAPESRGAPSLSEAQALASARDFVAAHVPSFDAQRFALVSERPVSHLDGDSLAALEWRSLLPSGLPGPEAVSVEVDRGNGNVVFFAVSHRAPSATELRVGREQAARAALAAVGGHGAVETAVADVWDAPRWTVTIDRGLGPLRTQEKSIVVVDGLTGAVDSIVNTA